LITKKTTEIYGKGLELDLTALTREARRINKKVCKELGDIELPTQTEVQRTLNNQLKTAPMSSRLHDYYNVFLFPEKTINKLYRNVCAFFKEICPYDDVYYVHAWLNYLEKGDTIPWHSHWGKLSGMPKTYVSSFYINAEPSTTIYKEAGEVTIEAPNKNNNLTLYEDIGDEHMVPPWHGQGTRISISMDIVPLSYIQVSQSPLNTWIPIV